MLVVNGHEYIAKLDIGHKGKYEIRVYIENERVNKIPCEIGWIYSEVKEIHIGIDHTEIVWIS